MFIRNKGGLHAQPWGAAGGGRGIVSRIGFFMRFVIAVASVIVLSLGLGGAAAYFAVDLTPPGLELLRPAESAAVIREQREEKQRTIVAEASGCKYCASLAEMAKTFSRRADIARTHAAALQKALPQVSDETQLAALRQDELKSAKAAASRAEAVASILTGWASRCSSEDFCKAPVTKVACTAPDESNTAAATLIALTVHNAAQQCATAACPAVDCQASAGLRSDLGRIEQSLGASPGDVGKLSAGASTVKAEVARITDETNYVANMLPLLLDTKRANDSKLNKLAPELADARAVSVAQLATVMQQAAAVADGTSDPRTEAAWRLKSLASHLAALGKYTSANTKIDWEGTADSLGAAMTDLARLQAMLDRPANGDATCATATSAAQQLREARAMLDVCRMRAACVGRGGAGSVTKAAVGSLGTVVERAQKAAEGLIVNEIGADDNLTLAAEAEPSVIDVLRSKGVCRRAGELRQASSIAPVVTESVATAAVPPALSPAKAISPQDVVAAAAEAALNAPTDSTETATQEVVQTATKPEPMHQADPDLLPAAAPPRATAAPAPMFTGPGMAFGGEGGPQLQSPPEEQPAKKH